MQGKSRWIGFLVIGFMAVGVLRTFALPKEASSLDRENRTVEQQPLPDVVFQRSASDVIKFFPLPTGTKYHRIFEGGDAGSVAGVCEKLIYQQDLGKVAAQVPPNQLVADDITYNAMPGSLLRRFNFQVIGKADPTGLGGAYSISYALYDGCPGAGGEVVSGTDGQVSIAAENDDVVVQVDITIPEGQNVPLPCGAWIGLKTSRDNIGIIMGAPASVGFSQDILDFPGFACNANIGGFPSFGHATFNVEVYGDCDSDATHISYRNVQDARGGLNVGTQVWMADDLELGVEGCQMVSYEVGVRGVGFYTFEILRDGGGLPGSSVSGTRKIIVNSESGFVSQCFSFSTPILLNEKIWMAARVGNTVGGWVLTGRDASWGRTLSTYARQNVLGEWVITEAPIGQHGGFYVTIHCAGEAPVGACCDMFLPNENGDVDCRDIPEMNCSFPQRGTSLRPVWVEGEPCRACTHGDNAGLGCDDISDCLGSFCVGGVNDTAPCTSDTECRPQGEDPGDCVLATCGDNDPFVVTCGVSACCKPDGATGDTCENLTRNECNAVEPLEGARQWDLGRLCNFQGQVCPNPACLARKGDCSQASLNFCEGGPLDGSVCDGDRDCRGYCDIFNKFCLGGTNDGLSCGDDSNCPDDGPEIGRCLGFCLGGDPAREGDRCFSSVQCEWTVGDGQCDFSGGGALGVCNTGVKQGDVCEADRDCFASSCECRAGCGRPFCCTRVCEVEDDFCCNECWDEACAVTAQDPEVCPEVSPSNDECAPSELVLGALKVELNDFVDMLVSNATESRSDPGFCCNTGPRARCVGGDGDIDGTLCDTTDDCQCDVNDFSCEVPGFCQPELPTPGEQALKTTWFRFDIPAAGEGESDFMSVSLSTCASNRPATDSLLQVFSIPTSDVGYCDGLGRCDDGVACNLASNRCDDGSNCVATIERCSIASQDCPTGIECVLDLDVACDNLSVVGCDDDNPDACRFDTRYNSKMCLTDLKRGESYIVLMGIKEPEAVGTYRLFINTVSSCPADGIADNNDCDLAFEVTEGQTPFDLDEATFSCPGDGCLNNMQNDIWYKYIPERSGTATFETCGPDSESTPDTEMIIYEGCVCPPPAPVACSGICDGECLLGSCSTIPVEAGVCYMVRLGDNGGGGGAGNLTITFEVDDCNNNGIADDCDISCGDPAGVCDVPGCGSSSDCNGNGKPDECETVSCCPTGPITFDPLAGTVDARYPYDPADVSQVSAGISTITVQGPAGALESCWSFCETAPDGAANGIASVSENNGTYTIELIRPITTGACSTLTYTDDAATANMASFISHPSNVDANGIADQADVSELINILNGSPAAYGLYSSDVNRSGETNAADLLAVIDLLNGADLINGQGPIEAWMNTLLPSCDACTQ